jgi:hypothetical protein
MAPGEGEGEREGEMEGEGEGEASPLRYDLSMPRDEDGTPYDTAAMLIRLRARAMSLKSGFGLLFDLYLPCPCPALVGLRSSRLLRDMRQCGLGAYGQVEEDE